LARFATGWKKTFFRSKNHSQKQIFQHKLLFLYQLAKISVKIIFATENQVSKVIQFSWTLNDARNGATTNTLQKPTPASHTGQIHPLNTISGVFANFSTVLPKIVLAMAETHPCVSQGSVVGN